MKYLLLALTLLSLACEAPDFAFSDAVPNCAKPSETSVQVDSSKGCWRVISKDEDHSLTHEEPANMCENSHTYCLVVVPHERFWVSGLGRATLNSAEVDCSEACAGAQ